MLHIGKYFLRPSPVKLSNSKHLCTGLNLKWAFSTTKKKASYYKILNVPTSATMDEIKEAYRDLAKMYHPDTGNEQSKDQEKFLEINEAYEVLSDPKRRTKYDVENGISSGLANAEVNIEFGNNDKYEELQKKRTSNKESDIDNEVFAFFNENYFNKKAAKKVNQEIADEIPTENFKAQNGIENFIPYSQLSREPNIQVSNHFFTFMSEFRFPLLVGMIAYMGYLTVFLYYKKNKNKQGVVQLEKVKEGRGHYTKLLPLNVV